MTTRIGHMTSTPRLEGAATGGLYPERFAGRSEAQIGKRVGLTQFGVNHVVLQPGAWSSLRHWHEQEDEFVYVLFGALTLVDENGEHILGPGDYAGFPAGAVNAHAITNRSAESAAFIVAGLRHRGRETLHYPDDFEDPRHLDRDQNGDRI
jgi:uncharacterized cupin superfamily protein